MGIVSPESSRPLGIEWVSAMIKSRTRPGYMPGSGEITVKVLAEAGSGRLLGGQTVGAEGSAKRIDTLATALHAGFTVGEWHRGGVAPGVDKCITFPSRLTSPGALSTYHHPVLCGPNLKNE